MYKKSFRFLNNYYIVIMNTWKNSDKKFSRSYHQAERPRITHSLDKKLNYVSL